MPKSSSNYAKCMQTYTFQHKWGWICVETDVERKFTSRQSFQKCYKLHTKRCEGCAGIQEIRDEIDLTKAELRMMNKKSYLTNSEYQSDIKWLEI